MPVSQVWKAGVLTVFSNLGLMFSVWSGLFGTVIYFRIYVFILNKFKNCFTLGEAGFVCQSIIIVFYCTLNNIIDSVYMTSGTDIQISTLIVQSRLERALIAFPVCAANIPISLLHSMLIECAYDLHKRFQKMPSN
ncbi:hypothetical protein NQ315_004415 [Exocentrus adspersus]|uniref:Uncharacterized protein n=1 Tax=Exocentrus adspersus TaxID=1586481 RepID=A0AAV8VAY5_9CUCU|nr:hypothetical protein NQ315_004415 [Exocentrus adspersus]